jgi:hypothetical protein
MGYPIAAVALTYPADEVDELAGAALAHAARLAAAELTRRVGGVPR